MRALLLLLGAMLLLGAAGEAWSQTGEVPAEQRLAVLRRVLSTRRSELVDTTRVDRCSAERLLGGWGADSLAVEGLAEQTPGFRCTPMVPDLPPATWVSIEAMRVRGDGLIEVDARSGFTCTHRRREGYLVERMPYGMVIRDIRIHGWESQVCRVRVPHLP
jgi:hypothetical protein